MLLAVVGDRWLASVDGAGRRRLDDPGDFVRLEIESALRAGVRVVPVLLGTELPRPEQLPPSLAELASRQAVDLPPQGFMDGAQRLVERLAVLATRHAPTGSVARYRNRRAAAGTDAAAELVSTAYRLQVADIAPTALRGRDRELAMLAAFCAGTEPYAWCQAEAWAGKTALMAWFVLHPPAGVDVAAFFVVAEPGRPVRQRRLPGGDGRAADRAGRAAAGGPGDERRPPGSAAGAAGRGGRAGRAAGRRLVLVIDGLDEDTGPADRQGEHRLAAAAASGGRAAHRGGQPGRSRASARRPPDHPLRECRPLRVAPSPEAAAHRAVRQA